MQVSCPHCGTQYNLTAKQVGPAGRTLQCAKCKHKWFVAPAGAAALAASDELPPLPPSTLSTALPGFATPSLDDLASIGSRPGWWRQLSTGWGPEFTLTLAGMGVAALAVFCFNWLLRYTPPDDTALAANPALTATHQPGPQPAGLVLSRLSRELAQRGNSTVLTIHGMLSNGTAVTTTLPDLRVQLLDREGVELDYWPVSYASPTLAPGQNTPWQVTFVNPPLTRVAAYRAFFTGTSSTPQAVSSPLDSTPAQE